MTTSHQSSELRSTELEKLAEENAALRLRLEEAEETIVAIRSGEVDAFVIDDPEGRQVYTLETADRPYRLFVEEMQQGAATLHKDGTIVWCNRQLAELLKVPQEKLLGEMLQDFIAPDDLVKYDNLMWQGQIRAGRGEAHLRRGDGALVSAFLTLNGLPAGCGAAIGVLVTDLTAQKHHEQLTAAHAALRDSEERYRGLFDSSPHATFVFDAETLQFLAANEAALTLYGYSQSEFLSRGLLDIRPPEDVPMAKEILAHMPQQGRVKDVRERLGAPETHRHCRKDGSILLVEPSVQRIRYKGHPAYLTTISDVTEQKRLEGELRQIAADLSDADHRKTEFLAMLAHELRNPLAPIRNAVQVLRLSGDHGEPIHSATQTMERQLELIVRLVDDLLDISRITRGKIELRKERIELASVVHLAVEASRSLVQCMEHNLDVTLPPEPIYLSADSARLAQVIGNLLNNACKFTDKGGSISLTVEVASGGRQPPDTSPDGDSSGGLRAPLAEAVIRVRDSGIGIAAEQLPRIFEMFMQIDTSLERTVSGLGIGLALVKSLVELHGGTVQVQSRGIGQGSEFLVRLPILASGGRKPPDDNAEQVELASNQGADAPRSPSRRILVVDDNRDSALTLSMLLKLTGHQTQSASDGLEAVEMAESFRPDVILLDIGLPKLNGYEACRRIRQQPGGQDIVLLALTGWGQEEDRQKSKDAGFSGHLVKPVDLSTLTKLLAEFLPASAVGERPA